ncbi:Adhesion G-protein coupled receptor V1 [Lamellibrachia satsuma]|nr:Adhesion G-protein coupled receptor V1 [Lamellibrachia satsuma]
MKEVEVELEELRLLVVTMVGREQGGCASSSGRKETGRKGTGGKTTGVKERRVGETGGKEKGVGETGGKTTGVKERGVGETRAKEREVGESGAKETGGKGSRQSVMEGIERKSYSAAVIEGVRKRAGVFVGDSIVRKTDRVLNKGDDVVVCLPGAKIEAITERVENITSRYIDITLDPMKASDNPFPKMFRVVLSAPTNAAELGVSTSVVTLVNTADLNLWTVWAAAQTQLDNGTIDSLIRDLQLVIKHRLTTRQLSIAKDILNTLLTTAESQELLIGTRGSIFSIFCQLLNPDRGDDDATRGHWQLSKYLERFAFTYVQSYACDTCCTSTEQLLASPECPWIQFSVAKWYPEEINGFTYKARDSDTFKVPSSLMLVQDHGRDSSSPKCSPVVFVQYSSEQWFTKGSTRSLLNHRMFTVDVKDQPGRFLTQPAVYRIHTASRGIAAKRAECVYFDEDNQQWTSGDNVCTVINNLGLAMDNYVDCSCRHMSNYAVWSKVKHPELIGYPVWFHISCFICMVAMVLVILCHHVCSFYAMFSANLLMHMCFAVFATELCYVIDAYLSPGHLLSVLPDSGNYRCIVMSLFLHYFFLAQFTWMMTQAVNFWKILVLNDEHTERKYVFYFLIGWGLPAVTVAIFYVVTYSVYRFGTSLSPDLIYGDVTDNDDICFTTNAYVALAGVVFPALLCLMVVGVIFIQTFQVAPQWQAYDDMYRGRYNKHEIRALLLFWACIVCTWLWGGLHMAYSQVWMLVLFCIFNIATGLYAIAVYALLRNPCLPCFRPQKAMYAINATVSDVDHLTIPATSVAPSVAHSVKGSRASLIQDTWEKESVPLSSHIRVKRTPAPPHHPNVYVAPPTPYSAQTPYTTKTPSRATGRQSPRQDIDDLIYALKNGSGLTTSDAPPTSPGHRYDRRKIPIADTHV